ncbi:hypothetical protein Shyhy01_04920 [Streptomyces hygroscopicus subsp. hygroscopicus]|uniref:hypothetical protein n=1 Tax=Streptomyces sp. KHY 26 TaxID=3097359 RepID=UPI0024A2F15E|nr:hypothetical protein [Streptomyces hygroscopicus]GLX47542.1 hypothetical protein Shyhy01_04920 [Streptomyces hygroscopicus subsp. hygroscopicus]
MTQLPDKARAWDLVSGSYWNSGYYGGPAPEHEEILRGLMRAGAPTAVVGASTVSLSKAAQEAGADLHVLDFAPGILREAGEWLGLPGDRRHLVDVTGPLPELLRGGYDLVLADRLVNRFSAADLPAGLRGLRDLVAPGGTLALTVRFGWYDRDRQIHDALTPAEQKLFWRPDVGEIDYATLPDRDIPLPTWGGISGRVMRDHLRGRGREARFHRDELLAMVADLGGLRRTDVVEATNGTALVVLGKAALREGEHHDTA